MNRLVQAPSHGGGFRSGQPTLIVIHSLEAPARRGLAYDLATGWLQGAGVSPHALTDPGETVDTCSESLVGWHCGNGNQYGIGLEVTGYAAWTFEQWTNGDAFAAVRLAAKRAAEAARRHNIPIRWLSLAQIRNGERGFCTHADISATLGGTNHTDPGRGFPFAIFLQMVQQWTDGTVGNPTNPPNDQPAGGTGGAQKGFLMALSDAEQSELLNKVRLLFDDNKLDGYPYGKQAAGFNDVREVVEIVKDIKGQVDWLMANERIPLDDQDPSKGSYPFTKGAATFNDLRELSAKVDQLIARSAK